MNEHVPKLCAWLLNGQDLCGFVGPLADDICCTDVVGEEPAAKDKRIPKVSDMTSIAMMHRHTVSACLVGKFKSTDVIVSKWIRAYVLE